MLGLVFAPMTIKHWVKENNEKNLKQMFYNSHLRFNWQQHALTKLIWIPKIKINVSF